MKTIIVTGAGSGIGRETARQLASPDMHVVLVGRRIGPLEHTSSVCVEAGAKATVLPVDVRDRKAVFAGFSTVGEVHGLVANSGICERTELHKDESDDVFDNVMATNVQGVWNTFRALNSRFAPGARAVVISSGLGKLARPGYSAYAASKHAVLGIAKCLALELAPRGIRVNSVCPGWVNTDMAMADLDYSAGEHGSSRDAEYAAAIDSIPLQRFVEPGEVAKLIAFLLSEDSSAITGQSYNISCGEFVV